MPTSPPTHRDLTRQTLGGLVWIGGRIHYALSYYRDPEARGPGFITGFASAAVLLVGALFGILVDLL